MSNNDIVVMILCLGLLSISVIGIMNSPPTNVKENVFNEQTHEPVDLNTDVGDNVSLPEDSTNPHITEDDFESRLNRMVDILEENGYHCTYE